MVKEENEVKKLIFITLLFSFLLATGLVNATEEVMISIDGKNVAFD